MKEVSILVSIEMVSQANQTLRDLMMTKWLTEELFSLRWWGLLGFLGFSYILCFKLMDKTRLTETILYGSLVSVFCVVLDVIVSNANLFVYRVNLFPMIPSIFIYDITALPLYYMLIYQHATSWKAYSIWMTLVSAAMGFIFTPLLIKLGYLQYINWSHLKAFLIITFVGFVAKAVMSLILTFEIKYRTNPQDNQTSVLLQPAMKHLNEQKETQGDKENKI